MKKYDQLKKTLRDYQVDIDKEKLWQQTSHAIPQKKKKRGAFIPFAICILLFLGGTILYKSYAPTFRQVGHAQPILEAHQSSISGSTAASSPDQEKSKPSNIPPPSNNTIEQPRKPDQKKNSESSKQKSNLSITKSKKVNVTPIYAITNKYPKSGHPASIAEDSSMDVASVMSVQINPEENYSAFMEGKDEEHTAINDKRNRLTTFGPAIAIDALPIPPMDMTDNEIPLDGMRKPILPHTPFRHIFYIGFLGGIGFSDLSFTAGDKKAEQMRALLAANTKSLESISATITGHMQWSNGFAAGAGLRYNRLTHEINYMSTITERTTTEGTTTIIIDEDGQQHLVSGSLGSTHIRDLSIVQYTTHQSLDLELTLYKTLMDIHRTRIHGYIKAGMNVAYGVTGSAFTGEQVLERFSENDNPFERSSKFTYGAGLHLQYRIHPKWILLGTAGFDQLNIRHREYQKLQWQNKSYSLSLGVGYVL